MTIVSKDSPITTLGLPTGDHWVKVHVEEDTISFALVDSPPANTVLPADRKPTGFVQKWGGSAKKTEDTSDSWLSHINEKHIR